VRMFGYHIINMRINKKTIIVIVSLSFLVIILLVFKIIQKEKTQIPSSQIEITPTPTVVSPTPASPCPLGKNVRGKLPLVTKNYTIEYFPVSQKFLVMILGRPFEKYKAEAEKWLSSYGIDPAGTCVSWGSPKVP